jgi:flavin-binding protein dodecin
MHLSALALSFSDHPDAQAIRLALDSAAKRIRALQVVEVQQVPTIDDDFLA